MGLLVFTGLHPFWFSLRSCVKILLGVPLMGPMPTHRLTFRRVSLCLGHFSLGRSPLGGTFCVCGLLEPKQRSFTDANSVSGFLILRPSFWERRFCGRILPSENRASVKKYKNMRLKFRRD